MIRRFSMQYGLTISLAIQLLASYASLTHAAGVETVEICTSPTGSETRKIQSTFTAPRNAPCKVNYETPSGTKVAADANFDLNKCLGVAARIKTNLERSGWNCRNPESGSPSPPTELPPQATPQTATPVTLSAKPTAEIAKSPAQSDDRTAVQQLSTMPWVQECIYSYPSKWKRNAELSDGEIDVYPGPGDPLAKHNFVYSVGNARFSHIERVFIAGKALPWADAQTFAPNIKRQDFDAAVNLRTIHPGQFVAQYALDGLAGGADAEFEKRGTLDLQGRYLSDGRFKTTSEKIDIIFQDQLLIASMVYLPVVDREPSTAVEPIGFTFSCSALSTMDLDAFRNLCKSLIEKATLNERSTEGVCGYSSEGRLELNKH